MKKQPDQSNNFTMGKAVFYLGGSILAFIGLGMLMDASAKNSTSGSIQDDNNARIATRIYNILKVSGALDWYYQTNYTSLVQIVPIGKEIVDWAAVQIAYKNLYGEDITTLLNENLLPVDYQEFLRNLQVKGNPTNQNGSTKIEQVSNLLVPGKSRVFLRNNVQVNFYLSPANYPSKIYLTYPAGTNWRTDGFPFLGVSKITYLGSNTSINLYQIQMINGTKVWVREVDVRTYIK